MARILIVDDEPAVLELIEAKLKTTGYETIKARNGREALEKVEAMRPDLILLDILLPEIDGFEVCRLLKTNDDTRDIPVIFLSGKLMEKDVIKGLELGAADYIIKPFSPRELAARVKHVIKSKTKETSMTNAPVLVHLEQKVDALSTLNNVVAAMNSMRDLNELLQYILEQSLSVSKAKIGSLMIMDDQANLRITNAKGLSKKIIEQTRIKSGEGISGSVAAIGEPLLVSNIEENSRFRRVSSERYNTKSLVCAPLTVRNNTIGVLNVNNKESGDVFNQDDLEILTLLANQAAVAIDNAKLYKRMNKNLVEFGNLKKAISTITHSHSLKEMIAALVKQATVATHASVGLLFLTEEKSKELYVVSTAGHMAGNMEKLRYRLGEGAVGSAVKSKKALIINQWNGEHDPLRDQVRNLIGQPLSVNGQILGFFAVGNKSKNSDFNADDLLSLATLSGEVIGILNTNRVTAEAIIAEELPHELTWNARSLSEPAGEFCSTIAHELRAPLTSIRGFSELLLDQAKDTPDATKHHYVEVIHKESVRLSKFIDDLLNITKLEVGQAKLDLRPVQLKALINEIVSVMESKLSDNKLEVEVPDNLPPIIIDSDKFSQILINLLSNAANYTPSKKLIKLAVAEEPDQFVITVADAGIGIPPGEQEKIFQKFYRVDNEINRQIPGTGLGLAIVKQLVMSLGGKISVKSNIGKGVRFIFTLPKNVQSKA